VIRGGEKQADGVAGRGHNGTHHIRIQLGRAVGDVWRTTLLQLTLLCGCWGLMLPWLLLGGCGSVAISAGSVVDGGGSSSSPLGRALQGENALPFLAQAFHARR
jgi:hypothetical protein